MKRDYVQISLGTTLGTLTGIGFMIAVNVGYLWWLGAIVGGLGGFILCDWQEAWTVTVSMIRGKKLSLTIPGLKSVWTRISTINQEKCSEAIRHTVYVVYLILSFFTLPFLCIAMGLAYSGSITPDNLVGAVIGSVLFTFCAAVFVSICFVISENTILKHVRFNRWAPATSLLLEKCNRVEPLLESILDGNGRDTEKNMGYYRAPDGKICSIAAVARLLLLSTIMSLLTPAGIILLVPMVIDGLIDAFTALACTKRVAALFGATCGVTFYCLLIYTQTTSATMAVVAAVLLANALAFGGYYLRQLLIRASSAPVPESA